MRGRGMTNGGATVAEPRGRALPGTDGKKGVQELAPRRGRPPTAPAKGPQKGLPTVIDVTKLMVKPAIMDVTVVGTAPLIVHSFGAKAIRQILEKQTGAAKPGPREKKDPFGDFLQSLYIIDPKRVPKQQLEPGQSWKYVPDTFGFPASAFKKALVSACSFVEGIPKNWVRGLVHIDAEDGDLLPLKYDRLVMHQGTVRVGKWNSRTADIRFRGLFTEWSVRLKIAYNRNAITQEQVAMLINNAGFSVGVGEWRPEKDGRFGRFQIGDTD